LAHALNHRSCGFHWSIGKNRAFKQPHWARLGPFINSVEVVLNELVPPFRATKAWFAGDASYPNSAHPFFGSCRHQTIRTARVFPASVSYHVAGKVPAVPAVGHVSETTISLMRTGPT